MIQYLSHIYFASNIVFGFKIYETMKNVTLTGHTDVAATLQLRVRCVSEQVPRHSSLEAEIPFVFVYQFQSDQNFTHISQSKPEEIFHHCITSVHEVFS